MFHRKSGNFNDRYVVMEEKMSRIPVECGNLPRDLPLRPKYLLPHAASAAKATNLAQAEQEDNDDALNACAEPAISDGGAGFERRGTREIDDESSNLYTIEDNLANSFQTICPLPHDLRESMRATIYTDKYKVFKQVAGEGDGRITHMITLHQRLMDVVEGVVVNDDQQAEQFRYLCLRRPFGLDDGVCR